MAHRQLCSIVGLAFPYKKVVCVLVPMRQPHDRGREYRDFLGLLRWGLCAFLSTSSARSFILLFVSPQVPFETRKSMWFSQMFVDPRLNDTLRAEILFLSFRLQSVKCILKYLLNNKNFIVLCEMFKILQRLSHY